ncbi:MAG: threonine-phosphate decarboxylase [Deltaproteobacteria bacterium]|nr:threonine-phosphate decarboxylase [Deltaproteobacteria bacterium]
MDRVKDIHGGNIWLASASRGTHPSDILDFSASINPLGFPASARKALLGAFKSIPPYPDPASTELKKAIANFHSIGTGEVAPANGSNELISVIPRLLKSGPSLIVEPAFTEYKKALELEGIKVKRHLLRERAGFRLNAKRLKKAMEGSSAVYIANPSNPSGARAGKDCLLDVIAHAGKTGALVVIDEAFADFTGVSVIPEAIKAGNVIVLRSMTKFYAMAGLRLGYAVGGKKLMARLAAFIPAWSVNTLASAAGVAALKDRAFRKRTLEWFECEREFLFKGLSSLSGLTPFESSANYVMVRLKEGVDARALRKWLLEKDGILIRELSAFPGLGPQFFRVAVLGREANKKLLAALKRFLRHS